MRIALCLAMIVAMTASARADKKIQGMTPGFKKEAAACQVEVRGLARLITGTTDLIATLNGSEKDALAADLAAVSAVNTTMTSYCSAVEDMVKFLEDNANAAYKSVEKDLDTRDNNVRKLRNEAKKALHGVAPFARKLIPLIKRPPEADPKDAPEIDPVAFPSKRKVVLPKLGDGTWSVSGSATSDTATYADKLGTASVTTRPFEKASCAQQRKAFAERSDTPAADLEVPAEAKTLGVAWSSRVATRSIKAQAGHSLLAMCVERGMGGVMVIADLVPANRKIFDIALTKLMIAMLAAQLEGRK